MGHDECIHEIDLALIQKDIADIKENVETITQALAGNGKDGLSVRVDRLEQTEKNRPSTKYLIFYASTGGAGMVLLAFIFKVIFL